MAITADVSIGPMRIEMLLLRRLLTRNESKSRVRSCVDLSRNICQGTDYNIMDRYCNVFELTIRPFKRIMVAFVEYATTRTDLIRHKAEGFEQIVRCDSIVLRYSTLSKKNNIHLSPAYNSR